MIETNLEQLDILLAEKRFWIKVAGVWAHVAKYLGRDTQEEVRSFTFRPTYLTEEEKQMNPVPTAATHHNAVRLKNGIMMEIPLIEKPVIPPWMNVTLKGKL